MTNYRTRIEYDILAAISGLETRGEQPYGLAIKRTLEDNYGTDINHGQLYPTLDRLDDGGYINKTPLDKRTNAYRLTNKGMGELRDRIGGLQDTMDGKQEVSEA